MNKATEKEPLGERIWYRCLRYVEWLHEKPESFTIGLLALLLGCLHLVYFNLSNKILGIALITTISILIFLLGAALVVAAWRSWIRNFIIRQTRDLGKLRMLYWRDFELLVGTVFRMEGYEVELRGGDDPDGGIDCILRQDGLVKIVQCKQRQWEDVGVRVVREMFGIMTAMGAQGAVVVTSGGFTDPAREFAAGKPIELIDGEALYRKLELIREKMADDAAGMASEKESPMQELLSQIIERHAHDREPVCPRCGGEMVPRCNTREQTWFWGCKAYKYDGNGCGGVLRLSSAEERLVKRITSGSQAYCFKK